MNMYLWGRINSYVQGRNIPEHFVLDEAVSFGTIRLFCTEWKTSSILTGEDGSRSLASKNERTGWDLVRLQQCPPLGQLSWQPI